MSGQKITIENGKLNVPNNPIIPFIEGDGIGPDIWAASVRVFDAAVEKAYGGSARSSGWKYCQVKRLLIRRESGYHNPHWMPSGNILVAIKGPLTTPVGGGIRSLNVALRQNS